MKNRKKVITIFLSGLLLGLISVYGATDSNKNALVYIVKQGDTLWNISLRFNANPWLWPKLWEQNKYITNPHLIYPGEPIALLPTSVAPVTGAVAQAGAAPPTTVAQAPPQVAKLAPEEVTTPTVTQEAAQEEHPMEEIAEETPAPPMETAVPYGMQYVSAPANSYVFPSMGSAGFLSKQETAAAGEIVATANTNRTIFGAHDKVFINLGSSSGVKEGDQFNIYKKEDEIDDPETGDFLGYRIRILGILKVTKVSDNSSTAMITESYQEIRLHDKLSPYEPGIKTITLALATNPIKGYIVASKHNVTLLGDNDVVYIDRGSNQGVQAGNTFVIYKDRKPVEDPATGETIHLPKEILGKLLVVKVRDNTATAVITKSAKEIGIGTKILADTASDII